MESVPTTKFHLFSGTAIIGIPNPAASAFVGFSYLILLAFPAWPKEIMRSMHTFFIASRAGLR
jgi:hypothetical protein